MIEKLPERVNAVSGLLQGRVLGCLVRPGMTQSEATRWLGNHCVVFLYPGEPMVCWYEQHGLVVSYTEDKEGTARVQSLRCSRSLDQLFR